MQYEVVVGQSSWVADLENSHQWNLGSDESLESKVNDMISQGWKPLGGVAVTTVSESERHSSQSQILFSQAMIKE